MTMVSKSTFSLSYRSSALSSICKRIRPEATRQERGSVRCPCQREPLRRTIRTVSTGGGKKRTGRTGTSVVHFLVLALALFLMNRLWRRALRTWFLFDAAHDGEKQPRRDSEGCGKGKRWKGVDRLTDASYLLLLFARSGQTPFDK